MMAALQPLAIFGLPRSGTTWLGQLLNAHPAVLYRYQPLFSYEFKDYLAPGFSKEHIANFHHELQYATSDFVCPTHTFSKDNPTTLLYKNVRYHHLAPEMLEKSPVKIIFISRDPVEVLNSWFNAPREFYPEWDIEKEWEQAPSKNQGRPEEFFGLQGWAKAEQIHRNLADRYPDRVKILSYQKLKQNTQASMKELLEWAGLSFHPQIQSFILSSADRSANDTYSIFKKPAALTLPEHIQASIKERTKALDYVPYYR